MRTLPLSSTAAMNPPTVTVAPFGMATGMVPKGSEEEVEEVVVEVGRPQEQQVHEEEESGGRWPS